MNCDTEQKVIILVWFLSENSYAMVGRTFHAFFGRTVSPPSEHAENFALHRQSPQVLTATGDQNTNILTTFFSENPHTSSKEASQELSVSQSSAIRNLKDQQLSPIQAQDCSRTDR